MLQLLSHVPLIVVWVVLLIGSILICLSVIALLKKTDKQEDKKSTGRPNENWID